MNDFYFLYIFPILYIEDVLLFHQNIRNDKFCVENLKFLLSFLLFLSMFIYAWLFGHSLEGIY